MRKFIAFIPPIALSLALAAQKTVPAIEEIGRNQEFTLRINLGIPQTLQVDFLPKNIIVRAPDTGFMFRRIVFSDAESISLQQTFEIRRPVFYKEEYKALQEFFKRVYALMNEEIVLKKKK